MKTFRAHTSFIPEMVVNRPSREIPAVILPKTDYEVVDTNQAFGLYVKVHVTSTNTQTIYISPEEIAKYGENENNLTIFEIKKILESISFAPSCVDFNWGWEVTEVTGNSTTDTNSKKETATHGFLINTTFKRPDTNTGVMGIGRGRRMWIEETASRTSIIMTAWICVDLIVKHEIMEAFLVDNVRILNPHKTLEELAYPEFFKK